MRRDPIKVQTNYLSHRRADGHKQAETRALAYKSPVGA
jgi:hypothetical protein